MIQITPTLYIEHDKRQWLLRREVSRNPETDTPNYTTTYHATLPQIAARLMEQLPATAESEISQLTELIAVYSQAVDLFTGILEEKVNAHSTDLSQSA